MRLAKIESGRNPKRKKKRVPWEGPELKKMKKLRSFNVQDNAEKCEETGSL